MLRMVKDAATDTATVSTLAGGCALVGQDLLIFFSVSIRFHIFRRKQKKKKKKKKKKKGKNVEYGLGCMYGSAVITWGLTLHPNFCGVPQCRSCTLIPNAVYIQLD